MFHRDIGLSLPSTSQVAERGHLLKLEQNKVAWFILDLQLKIEGDHFTVEFEMRALKRCGVAACLRQAGTRVQHYGQNPSPYVRARWVRQAQLG